MIKILKNKCIQLKYKFIKSYIPIYLYIYIYMVICIEDALRASTAAPLPSGTIYRNAPKEN